MDINRKIPADIDKQHYDMVVIGSGFGSSFFLSEALKHTKGRVLIVEWGDYHPWAWQIQNQLNTAIPTAETYANRGDKPWNTTIALGGGMNCWFSQTPRMHPSDFATQSRYGIGHDWPISYDDLEPYYCQAEQIMSIAGDADMHQVLPRSQPFPQPPHKGSSIDEIMKQAMPDRHFIMPTGRARVATGNRSACCANATCNLCPVNAKFTAENGFSELYSHPQVDVCLKTEVRTLESQGGAIRSATLRSDGTEFVVHADLFVLGANAIQSPAILLRSGIEHGDTGRGLHEQVGLDVEVYLNGLGNFDGSTITTGLNYSFYDGDFRRERSACLVYFENRWPHGLRLEPGRWNETLPLMLVTEDLPNPDSRITVDPESGQAIINYAGESEYAERGIQWAFDHLGELLAPLPVESIEARRKRLTESHVQGTLRMGENGDGSVVDANMIHHTMRNLVVVGTSTYPSCSPANPSLTAAALSLRAANLLFS
ncbi:Choline dehydrogenase [Halopseudomonas xinjiangensis]|uniref:Choline dehydrogenase n=1 Tax=Halopseudomonas xinjiangensis TaxID=487184 RepID=A0A1H1MF58_9GAMM|nr:GMC family oxidoreductase [Halopseudomonas xinjiangensis]SDR84995.1 Choline dehydrogenase [Halopseudomonas xinjiangensis]